jgi:hypothetical protein
MRNMLALFGTLLLAFLGCGYFLGWYKISTTPGPDGHRSVTIDLNTKKIGEDIHSGVEKAENAFEKNTSQTTDHKALMPPVPGAPSSSVVTPPQWWSPTSSAEPFAPTKSPEDVAFPPLPTLPRR